MAQHHLDLDPSAPIDTLVVGGGLAGLTAATTAARAGGRTVLLDAHPLGGRARVDDRGGFRFNRGPRALYLGGVARPLLEALGIELAGGAPAVPAASARHGGRLHRLPSGPWSLLRTTLLRPAEKARLVALLTRIPKVDPQALTGTGFGTWLAGLGLSPVTADLIRMLARVATYAAEPDAADAGAVVAQLQLALDPGVRYLDGGFQAVVDQLAAVASTAGVEVRRTPATSVRPALAGADPEVGTADGPLRARTVVLATGTPAVAARLLDAPVAGAAGLTPPVTAACLELGLRRAPTHPAVFGVGEPLYLSTHCPPARLAPPGHVVVHLLRNHAADEALDARAQRRWLEAAARQAGVTEHDVVEQRFLADMVVTGGLPTAAGGGLPGRPPVAHDDRPGVLLAGDWVGPVGLLADGAVASGVDAGRRAGRRTATMAVA